jgi:outer membrane protein TolC
VYALLSTFSLQFELLPLYANPDDIKSGIVRQEPGSSAEERKSNTDIKKQPIYLLDAIQKTFLFQPSIQVKRSAVAENKGVIKITGGSFDWRIGASGGADLDRNLSYDDPYTVHSRTVVPQAGISLKKDSILGPSMESSYTLKQYQYNYTYKNDQNSERYETRSTENVGRFDFKINVPLLPLVGDTNYGADLIAQKLQYKASLYELQAVISEAAYNTAVAYWNYVYAYKQLEVLKGSRDRARVLLENTKALARGGEVPLVEIENARGNLADKINAFYNAEQLLVEAKSNLAQTIGISFDDLNRNNVPADDFPVIQKQKLTELIEARSLYCAMALQKRMEIGALAENLGAADAQVTSARNRILPNVNLQLGLGYEGKSRGDGKDNYFSATQQHQPGLDMSILLIVEYPLGNDTAHGRYEQKTAQYSQLKVRQKELNNTISSNVLLSLYGLKNAVNELEKTEEAVIIYENAFNGERQKFRAGDSTLLNVIDIQNRLDNVLINRLSVRKKTAMAIVRLRYETGTLIKFENNDGSVAMSGLITVPTAPKK